MLSANSEIIDFCRLSEIRMRVIGIGGVTFGESGEKNVICSKHSDWFKLISEFEMIIVLII